jgi:hypothetical protein
MAKLQAEIIALADYASISRENKLTIAGIFDRITVSKFPSKRPTMFLVVVLKGTPKTRHKLKITIDSKIGKEIILKKELGIGLGDNGKANLVTGLVDFPLKYPGEHKISLKEGKAEVGYFLFSVRETGRGNVGKKKENLPN